ncbi:hypothetical protein MRX96_022804 [Rhipicephalus microplus]
MRSTLEKKRVVSRSPRKLASLGAFRQRCGLRRIPSLARLPRACRPAHRADDGSLPSPTLILQRCEVRATATFASSGIVFREPETVTKPYAAPWRSRWNREQDAAAWRIRR